MKRRHRSNLTCYQSVITAAIAIAFGLSAAAQESPLRISLWPQRTVVTMPVAGMLSAVPDSGTAVGFAADDFNPAAVITQQEFPRFTHDAAADLLRFDIDRVERSRD